MPYDSGEEQWRSVPIDEFRERYEVSSLGRVRNIQFPKILAPKISTTGYKTLKLHANGKGTPFKLHQLVALAFISHPPTDGAFLVNHINGDKLDNRATNLEWATKSSNASHAHTHLSSRKRKGNIYLPSVDDLHNETWLGIKHPKFPLLETRYEISNVGRVRRLNPSRGTTPGKFISNHELGGYIGVTLSPTKGRAKTFHLHLLVAWTFLPLPDSKSGKLVVDHIDSNPMNPRANNLRWVTYRQNAVYGFGKLTQSQVEKIQREYASGMMNQGELAQKFSVSQQHISRVLRGRQREGKAISRDLRFSVTAEQVNQVRDLGLRKELTIKAIAAKFSITPPQVANILSGKSWGDLPCIDGKPWTPIPRRRWRRINASPRLSQQDIEAIKMAYRPGEIKQTDLAMKYGIDRSVISRIVSKRRRRIK